MPSPLHRPPLSCEPLEDRDLLSANALPLPSLSSLMVDVADHGNGRATLRASVELGTLRVGLTMDLPSDTDWHDLFASAKAELGQASQPHRALDVGDLF